MTPGARYHPPGRWTLLLTLFLPVCCLQASNDNYPAGARSAGMGNASVMYPDFWSLWQNQAGLGYYSKPGIAIHHENRFMVPGFGLSCVGLAMPVPGGTLGFSLSRFGYSRYRENKLGLALGKAFHKRFSAGLQINYLSTFIDDQTGRKGSLAMEAGIMAEPSDNILIGIHVYNPWASRLPATHDERVPTILRMGMGYRFGERLFLGVETEKDLDIPGLLFKSGLEYRLMDYLCIRTGINVLEYVRHFFGFGLQFQKFHADLAFSFQPVVGYTPHLSLRYDLR